MERQRVNFIFDIYKGSNLVKRNSLNEHSLKKASDKSPTSAIEVVFAGLKVKLLIRCCIVLNVTLFRYKLPQKNIQIVLYGMKD